MYYIWYSIYSSQERGYLYTLAPPDGRGEVYCFTCPSFRPSKIFFVTFFSATIDGRNLIASYRYDILWEVFLDPSDSYFLFADLVGWFLYTLNIYAGIS
jgi:hypothetical protein